MSIKAVLAAVALLAAPSVALACTPAAPPKLTAAEQLARARDYAGKMASPLLAKAVREAADISVVRVEGYEPAPVTDMPERYRENLDWYRRDGVGLAPASRSSEPGPGQSQAQRPSPWTKS